MAENTLDIVNFIENNPVTKLSNTYQSKLLQQIQHELTDEELNIFSTNFYCFLNYHPKNDFIIDLDNVWKWLGFSQKVKAKQLLERNFTINTDYTLLIITTNTMTSPLPMLFNHLNDPCEIKMASIT